MVIKMCCQNHVTMNRVGVNGVNSLFHTDTKTKTMNGDRVGFDLLLSFINRIFPFWPPATTKPVMVAGFRTAATCLH